MTSGAVSQHPLEPLRRALRVSSLTLLVAMPVALTVGWLVDGPAGLLGALLGLALPVGFFAVTIVTALVTVRLSPGVMGAVVLGSWAVKIILLIVALALMDQSQAWSRPVFIVVFALTVPAWLALEAWTVVRTRQRYTAPV